MKHYKFTAVVYHYVRDLKHSLYPAIKGLDIDFFLEQIDYLQENYTFIDLYNVLESLLTGRKLPPKAVLLTFNDNLIDHFNNVLPILKQRGIKAVFYSESSAVNGDRVLQPHKIHFILASAESPKEVKFALFDEMSEYFGNNYSMFHDLDNQFKEQYPYDSSDTSFIKMMLQYGLDRSVREEIADHLFNKFVDRNQKDFSRELYMNRDHIKLMIKQGMSFGILGDSHQWLGKLSREEQESEIMNSVAFLKDVGMDPDALSISYPFGSYNNDTLDILKSVGCHIGFTGKADIADLNIDNPLELPRLDTNDIPVCQYASPNEWYYMA